MIPTGRRDGMVSVASNVRPNIVDTSFSMDQMIQLFATKGLSLLDLVVLSGACSMSKNSYNFTLTPLQVYTEECVFL